MQDVDERNACAEPGSERSLLRADQLARWQGSPIAWIEASPHTMRSDLVTERNGLVMIDSGATQADFRYSGRATSWEFTPGSIGFFARGTELTGSRWRWTCTRRIYIDLDADVLQAEGAGQWPLAPAQTEVEFRDEQLTAVLRGMVQEVLHGCPHGALFAQSLSLGVGMRLKQRARSNGSRRERGKLTAHQLRQVQDLVRSQRSGDVTLAALAAATGFSAPQFVRLFKNTLGCTPYQYVLQVRLERARALVLAGELPLAIVAHETGFASQSHMTAAFVRAFHSPPGEMRRVARTPRPREP